MSTCIISLEQYGSLRTEEDFRATFNSAVEAIMEEGGGMLIIPRDVPVHWPIPQNIYQETWQEPAPPSPATTWGSGPGVTVLDCRAGTTKMMLPQLTGMDFIRTLCLPEGQGMGSWNIAPVLSMHNQLARGSCSYREWITEDVPAGKDRRFYVRTIRGVFPGMLLKTGDDKGTSQYLHVKSIGYDVEKGQPYFIADANSDFPVKSTLLHNKNHTNTMFMDVRSHTEEQTFDLWIERHNYSQGDTYLYDGRFFYMSDVHSTGGDENGVIFAGFPYGDTDIFKGVVTAYDARTNELAFEGDTSTMGTGRPMINMNPEKWISGGSVIIVRPGQWIEANCPDTVDPVFEGKTYPTTVTGDSNRGGGLRIGGLIRFSQDAPLTPDVVGRYFAVDQDDELVPSGKLHRWYLIDGFTENPDGTKEITVIRHWWGAKTAQSITLYKEDNYTRDAHIVPMKYIITPGANVYDVAGAVVSPEWVHTSPWVKGDESKLAGVAVMSGMHTPTVKVSPGPHTGTPMDFAPGDAIEQAIGPDPFRPIPFRSWCFEQVPGIFPSPIFDITNSYDHNSPARTAVMKVFGAPSLEHVARRYDRKPSFEHVLLVQSAVDNGVTFEADVTNAALFFKQPNQRAQPIKWLYADSKQEATLTVSPEDGTLHYTGGNVAVPGVMVNDGGLSASSTPARNLRGIDIPVPARNTALAVTFPLPEPDKAYMVVLQLSWLTNYAIVDRTPEGFTVQFGTRPAREGLLSWLLVR